MPHRTSPHTPPHGLPATSSSALPEEMSWEDYVVAPASQGQRVHKAHKEKIQEAKPLSTEGRRMMQEAHGYITRAVSHWRVLCMRAGYEQEDAAQMISLIFWRRQVGEHPYDPSKSSLKSYCYMLTMSVLRNRLAKRRRHAIGRDGYAHQETPRAAYLDLDALSELRAEEEQMSILFGG